MGLLQGSNKVPLSGVRPETQGFWGMCYKSSKLAPGARILIYDAQRVVLVMVAGVKVYKKPV